VPRGAKMVQGAGGEGQKKFQGAAARLPPIFAPMRGEVPNAAAVLQLFSKK